MASRFQEKMLLMGGLGVGKSTAAISIADALPGDYIHYIVADRAIDRVYTRYPDTRERNVIEYDGWDFEQVIHHIEQIRAIPQIDQPHNWVVIDTIGEIYKQAQEWLAITRYKMDLLDLKEKRMSPDGKSYLQNYSIDGLSQLDWRMISRRFYNDIVYPLVRYSKLNTVFITHPIPIQGAFFQRQLSAQSADGFKSIGLTVDTQRDLPNYLDTVIYMEMDDKGQRFMRTIKETGRSEFHDPAPFSHFWNDYVRLTANGHVG